LLRLSRGITKFKKEDKNSTVSQLTTALDGGILNKKRKEGERNERAEYGRDARAGEKRGCLPQKGAEIQVCQ
jgi:hypothetical protein